MYVYLPYVLRIGALIILVRDLGSSIDNLTSGHVWQEREPPTLPQGRSSLGSSLSSCHPNTPLSAVYEVLPICGYRNDSFQRDLNGPPHCPLIFLVEVHHAIMHPFWISKNQGHHLCYRCVVVNAKHIIQHSVPTFTDLSLVNINITLLSFFFLELVVKFSLQHSRSYTRLPSSGCKSLLFHLQEAHRLLRTLDISRWFCCQLQSFC